jgi:hypothetical protein
VKWWGFRELGGLSVCTILTSVSFWRCLCFLYIFILGHKSFAFIFFIGAGGHLGVWFAKQIVSNQTKKEKEKEKELDTMRRWQTRKQDNLKKDRYDKRETSLVCACESLSDPRQLLL